MSLINKLSCIGFRKPPRPLVRGVTTLSSSSCSPKFPTKEFPYSPQNPVPEAFLRRIAPVVLLPHFLFIEPFSVLVRHYISTKSVPRFWLMVLLTSSPSIASLKASSLERSLSRSWVKLTEDRLSHD